MAAISEHRRRVRGPRPQDQRARVDRHPRRSDLRLALATARAGGSLCMHGLQGEIRQRLRNSMGEGDELGPLRRRLIRQMSIALKASLVTAPYRSRRGLADLDAELDQFPRIIAAVKYVRQRVSS